MHARSADSQTPPDQPLERKRDGSLPAAAINMNAFEINKTAKLTEDEEFFLRLLQAEKSFPTTTCTCTCESNQAILQVDLLTDNFPTYWSSRNFLGGGSNITNPSVAVLSSDVYSDPYTFYSDLYCLDRSNCYEFTMYDAYGDGICCNNGIDNYTVVYDNDIVAEGGEFGFSETSIRFVGDGCPSTV